MLLLSKQYYVVIIKYIAVHDMKIKVIILLLVMTWALLLAVPPGVSMMAQTLLRLSVEIGKMESDLTLL